MAPRSTKAPAVSGAATQEKCAVGGSEMEWESTLKLRSGRDINRRSSGWEAEELVKSERRTQVNDKGVKVSDAEDDPRKKLFSPILAQVRLDVLPKFIRAVRRYYDEADQCPPDGDDDCDDIDLDIKKIQRHSEGIYSESEGEDEKADDDEDEFGSEEEYDWETDSELSSDGSASSEEQTYSDQDEEMEDEEELYGHLEDLDGVCSVTVGPPIFGRFHVLFPLEFEDGVKWLIKIPVNGAPNHFDDASERALRTEALTMDLLKRKTTIPLPRVFGFETTCENEINCPFILMEFVSGKPLSEYWYHDTASEKNLERYRHRILEDIADAMIQLVHFSFGEAGFPEFDVRGELTGDVGPLRFLRQRVRIDDELRNKWKMPLFVTQGPFEDTVDFFQALSRQHRRPTSELGKGALKFLRTMLFEMPEESNFVLAHPDLDFRNIIVSEGGEIAAFIGWTDVCAVPRCIGNEAYPRWLFNEYLAPLDKTTQNDTASDNSSIEDDYRRQYDSSMIPTFSRRRRFNHTENSHFNMCLYIAARSPEHTMILLENLFKEIVNISGSIRGKSKFKSICHVAQNGRLVQEQDLGLKDALDNMLAPPACTIYRQYKYMGLWTDREGPPRPKSPFPYLD